MLNQHIAAFHSLILYASQNLITPTASSKEILPLHRLELKL